jgi:hypothetical protein
VYPKAQAVMACSGGKVAIQYRMTTLYVIATLYGVTTSTLLYKNNGLGFIFVV